VLTGNLDPVKALRNSTPEAITAALGQCYAEAGRRYVVAAGCEVPRDTPQANVEALRDFARSHS
jgi:uroporphyrinogen-III decarboxylase